MEVESLTMDAEEQALRDLGRETDRNEYRPLPKESSAPEKPESRAAGEAKSSYAKATEDKPPDRGPSDVDEPEIKPDSSDLASDIKKRERDEQTGQFKAKQAEKAAEIAPAKPETEYSRAQKEQERKDRSWQALEAQKAEFRAQQAQWEEKARIAQLQAAQAQNQPIKKDGLTAREYYEGYLRFKQTGDYENAAAALEVAMELNNAEQGRMAQQKEVQAEYMWRTDMDAAVKQLPDLGVPGSPVLQRLDTLIQQNPWIYYIPHGFLRAAEIADLLVKSDSISELQDENEKLRAELERRNASSQPSRGGAISGARGGEKSFDDMDLDEMEDHLTRQTREADSFR